MNLKSLTPTHPYTPPLHPDSPLHPPPPPHTHTPSQEDLLDCHEFLRWLVERVDQVKPKDTKSLQLYLPIVLRVRNASTHSVSLLGKDLPDLS